MYMEKNELNIGLWLRDWVENTIDRVKIHRLSDKEKVPGAAASKEVMMTIFLDMKRSFITDFFEKNATILSNPSAKFTLFIEQPLYFTKVWSVYLSNHI